MNYPNWLSWKNVQHFHRASHHWQIDLFAKCFEKLQKVAFRLEFLRAIRLSSIFERR